MDNSADGVNVIAQWAVSLMDKLGSPGVGLAIALENIFPPIPSEVILPLAGLAASSGSFHVGWAIAWATIGSLVGAMTLYALGAWLGLDRLRRLFEKMPLVNAADVDKTSEWFGKHGSKAVLFGRMLPIFRSFISIPAGIARMPLAKFLLLTGAGSLVWNTIFVGAGFLLGENWHIVEEYAGILQIIVIGAVVVAVAWFIAKRIHSNRSSTYGES